MNTLQLKRLSFGALCLQNDFNLPDRAEAMGSIDIDGDIIGTAKRCGVKPGDLCVDVGAFIGDTAWALATGCGAVVHAIEPFFDAYVCAVFNNRGLPVTVHNRAAGNGERIRLVYDAPCNEKGPNLGMRSVREVKNELEPALVTLKIDDLNLPSCKFMKIDCEGSEIPTLLGARKTIEKFRPYLYVEHFVGGQEWRGFTTDQLTETIKSLGYELEMQGSAPRWDWICKPL